MTNLLLILLLNSLGFSQLVESLIIYTQGTEIISLAFQNKNIEDDCILEIDEILITNKDIATYDIYENKIEIHYFHQEISSNQLILLLNQNISHACQLKNSPSFSLKGGSFMIFVLLLLSGLLFI